jgi:peptide chain release factor 3
VKAKGEQRRAVSDFMDIEQQRGISISSAVLTFDYKGKRVNVLDTPGHRDFSEDTYRSLAAADNAVMLVDGAKGLEPQTRKLFAVARLRRLPLFTFVNKLDRPALSPFEIMDQIEAEFGVVCVPVLWPIGCGERFKGVLDRRNNTVHLFARGKRGMAADEIGAVTLDDPLLAGLIGDRELFAKLQDDVQVLDGLVERLDLDRVMRGEMTAVYFGSAMTNFGVQDRVSAASTPRPTVPHP